LVVRRLFELMILRCRSPGSKELEILVLGHELSIPAPARQAPEAPRDGPGVLGAVESGTAASGMIGFLGQSANAAALAVGCVKSGRVTDAARLGRFRVLHLQLPRS
jgi:hypothetical protein